MIVHLSLSDGQHLEGNLLPSSLSRSDRRGSAVSRIGFLNNILYLYPFQKDILPHDDISYNLMRKKRHCWRD